jgi:hypothetical protein
VFKSQKNNNNNNNNKFIHRGKTKIDLSTINLNDYKKKIEYIIERERVDFKNKKMLFSFNNFYFILHFEDYLIK